MAEAVEEILDEVHQELDALEGIIPWTHDAKKAAAHTTVPSIRWQYDDFEHGNPEHIGGQNAAIGTRDQMLNLIVRHKTKQDAIRIVEQLQRCFRKVIFGGPNCRFGKFRWITDDKPANLHDAVKLAGPVMVKVQIRRHAEPRPNAKIAQTTHSVSVNDEEVC